LVWHAITQDALTAQGMQGSKNRKTTYFLCTEGIGKVNNGNMLIIISFIKCNPIDFYFLLCFIILILNNFWFWLLNVSSIDSRDEETRVILVVLNILLVDLNIFVLVWLRRLLVTFSVGSHVLWDGLLSFLLQTIHILLISKALHVIDIDLKIIIRISLVVLLGVLGHLVLLHRSFLVLYYFLNNWLFEI